ncbi:MAG: RecX family transcriptional regulator [Burkholderiaceae bacterium]
MQAIALLSRREHSRQELRAKLLAALRRRAREDAAAAANAQAQAEAVERALRQTPSNGIDDAFLPRPPALRPARPLGNSAVGDDDGRLAPEEESQAESEPQQAQDQEQDREQDVDPEAVVDALLDWLAARGYLSDERFVESRVHARAAKQGAALIRQELARHGLALQPEQATALRESEFARAQALWQRKFAQVADEPRERARQARFLASRGFAADVVRRIVGGQDEF